MSAENPLLDHFDLPRFDRITPQHVEPAVTTLVQRVEKRFKELEQNPVSSWDGLLKPLEDLQREIHAVWGPVSHLQGVKNSPELRQAYQASQGKMVELRLRMAQSEPIFKALKKLQQDRAAWQKLERPQQRIIEEMLLNAKLSGIELQGKDRVRFNEISKRLSELATQFSNNVLDSTKEFQLVIKEPTAMKGMPQNFLEMAAQSYNGKKAATEGAATAEKGPWLITLDFPSYGPFMQHCQRRDLREQVYRSYVTRSSAGQYDNTPLLQEILRLRKEMALLLGYPSFAHQSLATKMAGTPEKVEQLEEQLLKVTYPVALREHAELAAYAKKQGLSGELNHWDVSFYAERLREEKYNYTEEEVRPYFPLEKVLTGLFQLVNRLFSVTVKLTTENVPVWHPDVKYYDIFDASGKKIAGFYLDPYSRPENKRGGAWMDNVIDRGVSHGTFHIPVAYLICNSTPPVGSKPSLLSFGEVETLFHEFGHGLQHMLTTVDYAGAAGINGVEWDAVELASQFMENWCFHQPTLMSLTAHYETKQPLPVALFEKIKAAKNYRSASMMARQLHFGIIDMELHSRFDPQQPAAAIWKLNGEIAKKCLALAPLPEDRFLCSFSHIFAGGYSAGYYSYKWAEVLSADAFSAFEEVGLENEAKTREVGQRYRDTILAMGGGEHPREVYRLFRGRDATPDALLRHSGLLPG